MAKKLDDRSVDKRVAHRYLSEGAFTAAEWSDYLKSLEDCAGRSEVLEIHVGAHRDNEATPAAPETSLGRASEDDEPILDDELF